MRYKYKLSNIDEKLCKKLQEITPDNFDFPLKDDVLLSLHFEDNTSEDDANFILKREIDRINYLTGHNITSTLVEFEGNEPNRTGISEIVCFANPVRDIDDSVSVQIWDDSKLETQLRLWSMAHESGVSLASRINFLFQIIEIEHPDTRNQDVYPNYTCNAEAPGAPNPMTESKFLRHIMSHGKTGTVFGGVADYCDFLGIDREMHNPTNVEFMNKIKERIPILLEQSKQIIEDKITKE